MRRRAFTLIEVMVAIVVTGLVVSLAYAAARAGFDTDDALARARDGTEAESVARSLLRDALRHASPGVRGGPVVFELSDLPRPDGTSSDVLRFVSHGIEAPLGASEAWVVTVMPAGTGGVELRATPRDRPRDGQLLATLPNVAAIQVKVLGRDERAGWLDEWSDSERSPVAVAIALIGAKGRTIGAPLVTRIGLEGNP